MGDGFYQGTTPQVLLTVLGEDLTGKSVYVTIRQGATLITATGDRLTCEYDAGKDRTRVMFRLTQEETLSLSPGSAEVHIRYIDASGDARATDKARMEVKESLLREVIMYVEGDAEG